MVRLEIARYNAHASIGFAQHPQVARLPIDVGWYVDDMLAFDFGKAAVGALFQPVCRLNLELDSRPPNLGKGDTG